MTEESYRTTRFEGGEDETVVKALVSGGTKKKKKQTKNLADLKNEPEMVSIILIQQVSIQILGLRKRFDRNTQIG